MDSKDFISHRLLYPDSQSGFHLKALLTDLGERGLYDAVSQCNRCGYCAWVCPTRVITGRETLSARGRNQAIRMLMERKLKKITDAEESLSTCLLCGACTTACYAGVPTADIVLEGRRSISGKRNNFPAGLGIKMLLNHPHWFAWLLKGVNLMRKLGLARLAGYFGIYHILGMPELSTAEREVTRSPMKFLFEFLKKDPSLGHKRRGSGTHPEAPKPVWLYFASCGPNYLYPEVGISTVSLLKRFLGDGIFLDNSCCGLLAYNYGKLEDARAFAKKNILKFESLVCNSSDNIPVIGDCSSCVAFMKSYEQLFADNPEWKPRARRFAESVRDILEIIPEDKILHPSSLSPHPLKVTYHDSCRACHGQGISEHPRRILKKVAGKSYVELPESDWCCGGAGIFAFTQRDIASKILLRKISNIAGVQADVVVAGATSCLIQIANGLKKYYPQAKVVHFSGFLDHMTKEK